MYKVLIADDETYIRNLLEKSLQSSGLPIEVVASVGDGEEAFKEALRHRPDIVVADIEMPFMNGLELIRKLQENGIQGKTVIISGYEEFDYARTAISLGVTDYLLKPFMPDELMTVLEKIIHELESQNRLRQNLQVLRQKADRYNIQNRRDLLKAVLDGTPISRQEQETLGFSEKNRSLVAAMILSVNGTVWDFLNQEQVEEFLKLVSTDYFSEQMSLYAMGLEPNKLVVCLHSSLSSREFREEMVKGVEKLSHSLMQYYDIVLYCSIGRIYYKLPSLRESYRDALAAWKKALDPQKRIWFYGEKEVSQTLEEPERSDRIRYLKNCIRGAVCTGNMGEARDLIYQLMPLYAMNQGKGNEYVFISLGELTYGIEEDMEKMGLEKADRIKLLQMSQRAGVISLLEIREILEEYLEACCRIISQKLSENRSHTVVNLVQSYIEEHLEERSLSVEHVAEIVHFSVSYLRQIFKEITGENFNEYLIRKRMEKAAVLLTNTSMKIQEISESCGYDNQRYFASSFKKTFGCTPTEYKAVMTKGAEK